MAAARGVESLPGRFGVQTNTESPENSLRAVTGVPMKVSCRDMVSRVRQFP